MTIRTLASQIAKAEGKKSQARIGDVREILKIIATLGAENEDVIICLGEEMGKIKAKLDKKTKKQKTL